MEHLWKVVVSVDNFGGKKHYHQIYILRYKVNSVTKQNVMVDGRRIKVAQLDKIQTGRFENSPTVVQFMAWVTDETKIEEFKNQLIERVKQEIEHLRGRLNMLDEALKSEPKVVRENKEDYL